MTEYEVLIHAKNYIDKMANGIDPLTDNPVPDSDLINNVRISRCLFYVSGVMQKAIESGMWAKPVKHKKAEFTLSEEKAADFSFSEKPIPISEIVNRINALVNEDEMKKLQYKVVTTWLLARGILETYTNMFGKESKRPTPNGESLGIKLEMRNGASGPYYVTVYDIQAQHFIIDLYSGFYLALLEFSAYIFYPDFIL